MKALSAGLLAVFGVADALEGIEFAGRTDPWIIRRILRKAGLPDSDSNIAALLDGYIGALPAHLSSCGARVLNGARERILEAAERPDIAQALLTGNVRRGAQTKLGYHGLWDYFPLGAFADDSETRNELGPHALRRAAMHWGVDFALERVWVVGDTPHDIACARALGARALAVATGSSTAVELASFRPDAVLEDLGDSGTFWQIIDGTERNPSSLI